MTNEKHEQHVEKASQAGDHQVAGKPIQSGAENATQQRIEKQTAARAYRFTKGDNPFTIDMGNGNTVQDARPQSPQGIDKQLLAENTVERRPTLSGEVSTDINQVIAPGHAVKFTVRADGGIQFQAAGQWDAGSWNQQMKALNEYFTAHPEAVNTLVAEARKHKGGITLNNSVETNENNAPKSDHSSSENQHHQDEQVHRKQEQNRSDRAPLSGEVSNDLTELIVPGHAVKFSLRADGGVNWQPAGHWDAAEWNAQLKALHNYFVAHPEKLNGLAADVRQNGGPLTLGIEASEPPPPKPHLHPSGEGSDRNQWLVGSGSINGHQVQIGGPNDVKIPAAAGPNTPVVLSTTDGSGETIHGRIIVDRNGQKFFYPDYSEDSQHRQHRVENPQQNMIQLTNAGTATYDSYERR